MFKSISFICFLGLLLFTGCEGKDGPSESITHTFGCYLTTTNNNVKASDGIDVSSDSIGYYEVWLINPIDDDVKDKIQTSAIRKIEKPTNTTQRLFVDFSTDNFSLPQKEVSFVIFCPAFFGNTSLYTLGTYWNSGWYDNATSCYAVKLNGADEEFSLIKKYPNVVIKP